ncbi:MAG: PucR family transcriptional regulator [Rhodococcus sp. (in: high G+C Gram-positive bacteria)]
MNPDDRSTTWIHRFVSETLAPDTLDVIVEKFDAAIAAEVPEILLDRELQRDLHASNREHARALLLWLTGGSDVVEPPAAAHNLARTIARRGLNLRVLMHIYRVGQRALLRYVADNASTHITDPDLVPGIQIRLLERAGQWISVSLEILTDTYAEERERGLRGHFARRTEAVQAILAGELEDPFTASSRLGFSVVGHHIAVALWTDDKESSENGIDTLEREARMLASSVEGSRLLTVPAGSRGLWAWLTVDSALALDALPAVAPMSSDIFVALGTPGRDLDGFRRSHLEALASQSISESTPHRTQVVRYGDVEIAHLLLGHHAATVALVRRELGGLDGNDSTSEQLRRTLLTYLRADRSPEAAARVLGVHKNTVRYRVQRAEKLLGHRIGGSNRLELELALNYTDLFGVVADTGQKSDGNRVDITDSNPL